MADRGRTVPPARRARSGPRWARAAALLVAGLLGGCRQPAAPPAPAPAPAVPGRAGTGAVPPPVRPGNQPKPQFTFASWTDAAALIRKGEVVATVSGKGGFSLILKDHTWVHPVGRPNDPLPKNPLEFVARNAPNAKTIRHSTE